MADEIKCAFNVNGLKEECQDSDLIGDNIHISETAFVIIDNVIENAELQDHLVRGNTKHFDIFTTLDNNTELSSSEVQYNILQDNIKIEDGFNADDIQIEFNNGFLYCEDCQVYCEGYCAECEMLVHILNKTVLNNADDTSQEEVPNDILEIRDSRGELRIFAVKDIPVGVKFGPFTGLDRPELTWKVKGGKFVVDKDKSKYLNWMQYISPARNISERNLLIFQYKHNVYYRSICHIQDGDELLVYFGEEYEDSLNRDVEMDFIPTSEHTFKDAFACTFCCFGYSSKSYLAKHKAICPENADRGFSIEDLMQCPSCEIYLDRKEYIMHHRVYCYEKNDRKYNQTTVGNGRKGRPRLIHKCQQSKHKTKNKEDLKNHTNPHREGKFYKCGICCRQFEAIEVLRLHVENTPACAVGKKDSQHPTGDYGRAHLKAKHAQSHDKTRQFKCSVCAFRTKYKVSLKTHMKTKHSKEFKYKCDTCDYKSNFQYLLNLHIDTKHLGKCRYMCETCDYKTNWKSSLTTHIETKHLKKIKYKCDTCDYKTNWKGSLKAHVKAKHLKKIKYKCDTCDYKTNWKGSLKAHVKAKHLKKFKYNCDNCDYKTNVMYKLWVHTQANHLK